MCLAVPVRVESVDENEMAHCRVGEGETFLDASVALIDGGAKEGDYLLVHAGFAIQKMTEDEAKETLSILRSMLQMSDGIPAEECGF